VRSLGSTGWHGGHAEGRKGGKDGAPVGRLGDYEFHVTCGMHPRVWHGRSGSERASKPTDECWRRRSKRVDEYEHGCVQ